MPRPGYKAQEPNGCSSYFLGIKVPGSVRTTDITFLSDVFQINKSDPNDITVRNDHLWDLPNSEIWKFKLEWGEGREFSGKIF